MRQVLLIVFIILTGSVAAQATAEPDRTQILAVIAAWYSELGKLGEGRPYQLTAPGFIDASPHYDYIDTGAATLGPRLFTSLRATALKFSYEVSEVRLDPSFAKVRVWERGYFYAFAAKQTYERAASTLFILERQEATDKWMILAHRSDTVGIPPNMKTVPMPDLSEAWQERSTEDGPNITPP